MNGRILTALGTLALALSTSGCLISSSTSVEIEGDWVEASVAKSIAPGMKEEDVLARMGDPTSRTELEDGSQILRWTWREERESHAGIFLLISTDNETITTHSTYVELCEGVVTRTWRD
jgi:hypothetical protein